MLHESYDSPSQENDPYECHLLQPETLSEDDKMVTNEKGMRLMLQKIVNLVI